MKLKQMFFLIQLNPLIFHCAQEKTASMSYLNMKSKL